MGCWVFIDLRNFVGFTTGGMAKTYLLTLFNLNEGVDKKLKETIDLLFGGEKNSNDNISCALQAKIKMCCTSLILAPVDGWPMCLQHSNTHNTLYLIKVWPPKMHFFYLVY